jgi:hypothetical protein
LRGRPKVSPAEIGRPAWGKIACPARIEIPRTTFARALCTTLAETSCAALVVLSEAGSLGGLSRLPQGHLACFWPAWFPLAFGGKTQKG